MTGRPSQIDDYVKQVDAFIAVVDAELAAKRIGNTVAQLLRTLARAEQSPRQFESIQLSKNIPEDNAAISAAAKDIGVARKLHQARLEAAEATLSTFRGRQTRFSELIPKNEAEAAIARLNEATLNNAEGQGMVIEAMIEAHKPLEEITNAIIDYTKTADRLKSLSPHKDYPQDDTAFYTHILIALESLERGDYAKAYMRLFMATSWNKEKDGNTERNGHRELRRGSREKLIGKIREEMSETGKGIRFCEQFSADILARISTVKEPRDIAVIVDEFSERLWHMSKFEHVFKDAKKCQAEIRGLLNALQDIHKSRNYIVTLQEISRREFKAGWLTRESPTEYLEATAALSKRFLRILYAKTFKAPELTTAPYTDKDPEAAVEAFCDDLAKQCEWQRLLYILSSRAKSLGKPETDLITVIHSYLEGKNFELAEQWTDAVLAYKRVLRSADLRAPIQAATDSIKAIIKTHPEAITEAEK